jgi:hypothetical protein
MEQIKSRVAAFAVVVAVGGVGALVGCAIADADTKRLIAVRADKSGFMTVLVMSHPIQREGSVEIKARAARQ